MAPYGSGQPDHDKSRVPRTEAGTAAMAAFAKKLAAGMAKRPRPRL